MRITHADITDLRFPTSEHADGSDAMYPDPDYSAVYITLHTDTDLVGHGLTFTIGRGNEVVAAAARALLPTTVGKTLDDITADFAAYWRSVTSDTQLRWIGPEKGAIHLATGALVNAVWDLYAKTEGKPLWRLVADMTPEQLVGCIDFRYITDAITPAEALAMLRALEPTKPERLATLLGAGYPAYTTSAGWLGYPDDKIRRLCREGIADGWTHFKLKVGQDLEDDIRRCRIVREEIGEGRFLMVDANQKWDVPEAIEWMKRLTPFKPLWIEEPTSPDDVLGHAAIARAVAPIGVATGEACQNRVVFKQLMQADAIKFCQIDSCRLGGVNEVLAVMLMAAKFNIPVCPHAGGVGLCQYVQHLSMIDYIAISGTMDGRITEWVSHLAEHFLHPCRVKGGRYIPPTEPGYSIDMHAEPLAAFRFPDGPEWVRRLAARCIHTEGSPT